jgi:glycosyltransferase involved in cell wall biosynthesis
VTAARATRAAARAGRQPSISAVVPMLDEAASAGTLLLALRDALRPLAALFEIVVVNDGSRDATREVVLAAPADCGVRYVELSRNFGKEAAISAGLEAARGEVVVILDADGQHPVEVIAEMLARWREGWDVAYGLRRGREGENLGKRLGAAALYRLLNLGSSIRIPDGAGDFRLMDRRVVETLNQLPERDRFMKGLYAWVGFDAVAVPFDVRPRQAGASRFRPLALARLAMSGLTAFSTLPLRAVAGLGVIISVAAGAYGVWVVFDELVFDIPVPGYPTIVASIMFFSGVQLLSIGIIGEYLGRVFDEVKRRPKYVVAETVDRSPLGEGDRDVTPSPGVPAPRVKASP